MKQFKYIMSIAFAAMAFNFSSCSLEEFNPSGATADVIFSSEEGLNSLVNAAYVNLESQFYGREDMVLFIVGGNDLFINIGNGTYGRQMSKYQETTPRITSYNVCYTKLLRASFSSCEVNSTSPIRSIPALQ